MIADFQRKSEPPGACHISYRRNTILRTYPHRFAEPLPEEGACRYALRLCVSVLHDEEQEILCRQFLVTMTCCSVMPDRKLFNKKRTPIKGVLFRLAKDYFAILATTPAPTVRPPSRIAKRRPSSIAIGVISSTSMETLSPGMHISVPSGSVMTPVTSVVRK